MRAGGSNGKSMVRNGMCDTPLNRDGHIPNLLYTDLTSMRAGGSNGKSMVRNGMCDTPLNRDGRIPNLLYTDLHLNESWRK